MELVIYHEALQHQDDGRNRFISLIRSYFNHPLTPPNNRNHDIFKSHLYDGINGLMMLMIEHDEIVGTFGALSVEVTPGIKAIKMPHRLHIRGDYTARHNEFIDQWFEPALYPWIASTGVTNIMQTMNEGNERPLFLSALRHNRRRRYAASHLDLSGQRFLFATWHVLPYLIYEMKTWQYVYWASLSDTPWMQAWRSTKPMADHVYAKLDACLRQHESGGWIL